MPPARYLPDHALPAYAYVPGRTPHPVRDPAGHSYGAEETQTGPATSDAWSESAAFLYGIDLFNHGYYWEAHESWEALWRAAPRGSADRAMLHALIKLCAAGVKARAGNMRGLDRHAARAAQLFRKLREAGCRRRFGLDIETLASEAARAAAGTTTAGGGLAIKLAPTEIPSPEPESKG